MNIIEQLKNNEKPFGLMSEEMQAKAREIGQPEFAMYMKDNTWFPCGPCDNFHNKRVTDQTYRLRPDYEEPEIVECEVYEDQGRLHCLCPDNADRFLNQLVSMSDFIGFKYEGNRISIQPRIYASEHLYEDLIKADTIEKHEVLTPTHVLFRKTGE